MAINGLTRTGNSRNNSLYGAAGEDTLDGGAGNDYLRGYGGNDILTGGSGADRFVFERTQAANGTDRITDFETGVDVLDFSLVGFGRGVLSQTPSNWIRAQKTETGVTLQLDLSGGGNSFETWANLDGTFTAGDQLNLQIGTRTLTVQVQGNPIGDRPNFTALTYDIGNGDRNGDGAVTVSDGADNDLDFDDSLLTPTPPQPYIPFAYSTYFLIGDRVKGLTQVSDFVPGVTQLSVPAYLNVTGADDAVDDGQFEVLYGTYDALTDIFTVTSTPEYNRNPTTATHTMIVYDNDTTVGEVKYVGGVVFNGLYAENQWYISDAGTSNAKLNYDADGRTVPGAGSMGAPADALTDENVIYGSANTDVVNAGTGVDIIYAGAGADRVFGGYAFMGSGQDSGDWLYGEGGADHFFIADVAQSGIDVIKDFNASEGDVIRLSADGFAVFDSLDTGSTSGWIAPATVSEFGALASAQNIRLALAATFVNGSNTSADTVYRVSFDGKDYLYWDAYDNGFQNAVGDVVVELTGVAAGGVQASSILLSANLG